MRISKKRDFEYVQYVVCRRLMKELGDGRGDPSAFKCSFDDTRLYQFQWKEKWDGYEHFVAFVEVRDLDGFTIENKEFAEWLGFDPLDPGGFEVNTEVYVYSPNSFPSNGLSSLLLSEAKIVLVTTNDILSKYRGAFSERGVKKLRRNNIVFKNERQRRSREEEIRIKKYRIYEDSTDSDPSFEDTNE